MSREFSFVQIGAHTGDEAMPHAERGCLCLLVEPVPFLYDRLVAKFAAFSNVIVVSEVIAGRREEVDLYYFRNTEGLPWWADQIASLSRDHIVGLGTQSNFPAGYQDRIVCERKISVTLNDLFHQHNIGSVRRLLVDTEGYDAPILMAADLDGVRIDEIIFERKHTDGVRRTGYRYNEVVARLEEHGYEVGHMDAQNDRAVLAEDWQERRETAKERGKSLAVFLEQRGHRLDPIQDKCAGVIYLAMGESHIREVAGAATMLRLCNLGMPVTIFTDQPGHPALPAFAEIRAMSRDASPFKLKVRVMRNSPYEKTLFLDTDTYVLGQITGVFDLLEEHDMCIARGPCFRYSDGEIVFEDYENKSAYNTGVIGYAQSAATRDMFALWESCMQGQNDGAISAGVLCDQHYFNSVVTKNPVFTTVNTRELDNRVWNLRCYALGPAVQEGIINDAVILHGKPWEAMRFWRIDLHALCREKLNFWVSDQ